MQLLPGGDLEGGADEARNANVNALKSLFYRSTDPGPAAEADATDGARLGRLLDLPVARWSMVFLPHQQVLLNVFQPQYTLMFEALLAAPPPWFYLHLLLPGGAENLDSPEYALPQGAQPTGGGEKAAVCGTLMQVVDFVRLPDARLAIIAQGLGRAVAVRATQTLPYARVDAQLLPDAEQLLAAACAARRCAAAAAAGDSPPPHVFTRMAAAAAVAEDEWWRAYENEQATLGRTMPPAFCKFNTSAAEASVRHADEAVAEATRATPMPPSDDAPDVFAECPMARAALERTVATLDAFDEADGAVEAEADALRQDTAALLSLEMQLWIALDAFLRGIAKLNGDGSTVPAPKQLLGLLPPAPALGWPEGFVLQKIVVELRAAAAKQRAMAVDFEDAEPYVPVHPHYSPRRRAQRLSYAIWLVIREEGLDLQPLLETTSTADRLRMATARLRDLAQRLQ